MITVKKLHKYYKMKKSKAYHALKGINIKFPNKGFVFIAGKSGCGKSTLLNIIGGLDTYDKGLLVIRGRSTKEFTNRDFDNYRNSYLGFVFQDFHLIDGETIEENISLALKLQGYRKELIPKRVGQVLKMVDLYTKKHHKISEISGGQKQRVAIARALVKNPQVIIADEPTGNLDSRTSLLIMKILKKLSQKKLVIIVTHDIDFANEFADRVIILKDGKIIQDNERMIEGEKLLDYTPLERLRFKKSTFPFKVALKMSTKSVFRKKFRLIFTILLFSISIGLFSFSTSFNFYDTEDIFYQSIKDSETTNIEFSEGYAEDHSLMNILTEERISQLNQRYPNIVIAPASQQNTFYIDSCGFESQLCNYTGKTVYLDDANLLDLNIIYGDLNDDFGDDNLGIVISDVTATYLKNALEKSSLSDLINIKLSELSDSNIHSEFEEGYIKAIYESNMIDQLKTVNQQIKRNEFRDYQSLTTYNSLYTYASSDMNYQVDSYYFELDNKSEGEVKSHNLRALNVSDRFGKHYVGSLPTKENEAAFSYNFLLIMVNEQMDNLIDQGEISSTTKINRLSPYSEIESFCGVYNESYDLETCDELLNDFIIDVNDFFGLEDQEFTMEFSPITYSRREYNSVSLDTATFNKVTGISYNTRMDMVINEKLLSNYLDKRVELEGNYFYNRHTVVALLSEPISQHEAFIKMIQADYNHNTPASISLSVLDGFMNQVVRRTFLIISLIFGGFASLLMFSYINQSIRFKRADIGTLRAIGAKGTDVAKIFVTEAMIISMISSLIGVIGLNYVVYKLNDVINQSASLNFKLFYINGLVYIILLLFAAIVALISCSLPLYRLIRMNPIDVIRKARD
ncbi:ATP-binding cassette domain-containing protein [Mycoplasmatota bacterium]|nr:ATP-binding cassette domain-containing protein [Mycoplasmatota bacterium]